MWTLLSFLAMQTLALVPSQLLLSRHPPVDSKKPCTLADQIRPPPSGQLKTNTSQTQPRTSGSRANICWRAVAHDDLRLHPLYDPLPEYPPEASPSTISPLLFHRFRQDSIQWDMLHSGRLTTSIAAACVGFYEESTAKVLGVPRSLASHARAISAWRRLCDQPLQDLSLLCQSRPPSHSRPPRVIPWKPSQGSPFPFRYTPNSGKVLSLAETSAMRARLRWGSAQEATAILVAVNFFSKVNASVSEVGLCPLECVDCLPQDIETWKSEGTLPPIGASPDGIITYPDGSKEVLEVKCSSPFVSSPQGSGGYKLQLRHSYKDQGVAVWHMAQLQLEILCAGPRCKGAVLVALSATEGTAIYRVVRDDAYILELLYWVRLFYINFCMKPLAPEPDFVSIANERYTAFLDRTICMSREANLVARLQQSEVQRSPYNKEFFI